MDETASLIERLRSRKSVERRTAAKKIGQALLKEAAEELYSAFIRETEDRRTWETQVQMVLSLGHLGFKPALQEISKKVDALDDEFMVLYACAQTYVRLARRDSKDASSVINLLGSRSLAVASGALCPLAYDKMVPSDQEIHKIMSLSWDLQKHSEYRRGQSDPRYPVAAACSNWPQTLTSGFLEHCLLTAGGDAPLVYACQQALKGLPVKLR